MAKRTNIEEYNAALTAEQRKANAAKASAASAQARRAHRLFREIIKDILAAPLSSEEEAYEALLAMGISDPKQEDAIMLATARKALTGDVEAVRFLRDTAGEKPTESFNVGVSGKPIKSLDLSGLSDEELEALADGADG